MSCQEQVGLGGGGQERIFLLPGQSMYFLLNIQSPTTAQATDDQQPMRGNNKSET